MVTARIVSILIGYLLGNFQTGYIYGKIKHVDIRQHGSGNAGATNTLRTLGIKAGLIAFFGDAGKAILAIFISWLLFHNAYGEATHLLAAYAGFGAVLGHNFPFYLHFKGGKGIACTAGFIMAFCPLMVPICLGLFIGTVALTRYVSLGSILVVTSFFIQLVLFGQMGLLSVDSTYLMETYVVGAAFALMAIYRHRANIVRLVKGTESKLSLGKKEK